MRQLLTTTLDHGVLTRLTSNSFDKSDRIARLRSFIAQMTFPVLPCILTRGCK